MNIEQKQDNIEQKQDNIEQKQDNIEQKQDNIESNSKEISKIFKKLSRDVVIHILLFTGRIRVRKNKIIYIIPENDNRYHMLNDKFSNEYYKCSRGRRTRRFVTYNAPNEPWTNTYGPCLDRISIFIPVCAERNRVFHFQKMLYYEGTDYKKVTHGELRTLTKNADDGEYNSSDSYCTELYPSCEDGSYHETFF